MRIPDACCIDAHNIADRCSDDLIPGQHGEVSIHITIYQVSTSSIVTDTSGPSKLDRGCEKADSRAGPVHDGMVQHRSSR